MSEFKVDDQVTIRRGKHRGPGIVVLEADHEGQIGVKAHSGAILITNADNLKAPDEVTIGVGALRAVLSGVSKAEPDFNDALKAVVDGLNAVGVRVDVSYTNYPVADTSA